MGSSDGTIHQLSLIDGTGTTYAIGHTVGDPTMDVYKNYLYVCANDGRVYCVSIPF